MERPSFGTARARAPASAPLRAEPTEEEEMAARRAAFVAQEWERRTREEQRRAIPPEALAAASAPLAPRSLFIAYCLWFFTGTIGGHRFYLGHPRTGMIQAGLSILFAALIAAQYYAAFIGLAAVMLWAVADGFLIESMHRKRRGRGGGPPAGPAFD
jgi:TM2 domain-containing membrane protein YozV